MRPTAKRRNVALETFETRYSEDQSSGKEERRPDQTETRCAPKGAEEPDEGSAGQPLHGVATREGRPVGVKSKDYERSGAVGESEAWTLDAAAPMRRT